MGLKAFLGDILSLITGGILRKFHFEISIVGIVGAPGYKKKKLRKIIRPFTFSIKIIGKVKRSINVKHDIFGKRTIKRINIYSVNGIKSNRVSKYLDINSILQNRFNKSLGISATKRFFEDYQVPIDGVLKTKLEFNILNIGQKRFDYNLDTLIKGNRLFHSKNAYQLIGNKNINFINDIDIKGKRDINNILIALEIL